MRIYLDVCCYNRPYDDQSQLLVSLETQAKLQIQKEVKEGKHELVSSYVLDFEASRNPIEVRKASISDFLTKNVSIYVSEDKQEAIVAVAEDIKDTGVKDVDALHVACAIEAECDVFLTTDKRLLKYETDRLKILSPLGFIGLEE